MPTEDEIFNAKALAKLESEMFLLIMSWLFYDGAKIYNFVSSIETTNRILEKIFERYNCKVKISKSRTDLIRAGLIERTAQEANVALFYVTAKGNTRLSKTILPYAEIICENAKHYVIDIIKAAADQFIVEHQKNGEPREPYFITERRKRGSDKDFGPVNKSELKKAAERLNLTVDEFRQAALGEDPNFCLEVMADQGNLVDFRFDVPMSYYDSVAEVVDRIYAKRNSDPLKVNHWISKQLRRLPSDDILMSMSLSHLPRAGMRPDGKKSNDTNKALMLKIPELNLDIIENVARQRSDLRVAPRTVVRGILDHQLEQEHGFDLTPFSLQA